MSLSILIIDDEDIFREDLATLLRHEGFDCRTAPDGESGVQLTEEEPPDVVLCDLVMPGIGGLEVVEKIRVSAPESIVFILTAYGSVETAVDAFRKGVADYVMKPVVPEDLLRKIRTCLEQKRLHRELRYLRLAIRESATGTRIIGDSPSMNAVRELIRKIAPASSSVLISGESGTGKELVARSIHSQGQGEDRPFVAVNCAALPDKLIESELFGHVKGAFTGASRDRAGYFEVADNGTLFLDEISELPAELQPKLLRALESGEIIRVGATRPTPTKARIIAATNRNLLQEIEAQTFREDLYFRLNVVEIRIPPLRDRREDIPALVEHLLARVNARLKRRVVGVDKEALRAIMGAPWRGNVRELENVLERAVLLAEDEYVGLGDLPPEITFPVHSPQRNDDLRESVRRYEREHIRQVLAAAGGNKEEAARRLGVNASTLYRRLKDLEI